MRIVYKTEEGGVAVIIPTDTVEACMKDYEKSVNHCLKHKIYYLCKLKKQVQIHLLLSQKSKDYAMLLIK